LGIRRNINTRRYILQFDPYLGKSAGNRIGVRRNGVVDDCVHTFVRQADLHLSAEEVID
jgi:hypothetical protein